MGRSIGESEKTKRERLNHLRKSDPKSRIDYLQNTWLSRETNNEQRKRLLFDLKHLSLFLLLLVATAQHLEAQTVTGQLIDAESGEGLVAASIEVKGKLEGTISNIDGNFEITLDQLPATLVFRFIGFQSEERNISPNGPFKLQVSLIPVRFELGAVTVTGENPAIGIMRRVIEKKLEQRERLQSWKAEAYTRFVASNDTGIVAIVESVSDAYWSKEDGLKEVAKGQRQTANIDIPDAIPAALGMQNMYDDDLEIAGFQFPGITHPNAFKYYQYALEGRRYRDDKIVYDISIKPKNNLRPGFIGKISVLDEAYALLRVELVPNKAFFFPPPIKEFEIAYKQQFSNYGGDYWMPIDFESSGKIVIGIPGLNLPPIEFNQLSSMTDYETEIVIPDSIRTSDEVILVDSVAVADQRVFASRDLVPLSGRELSAYESIDSTMTIEEAFKPTGFFSRWIDTNSDGGNATVGPDQGRDWWSIMPNGDFNRVQSYSLGGKLGVYPWREMEIELDAAYSTGPKSLSYSIELGGRIPGANRWNWSTSFFDNYGKAGRHERYIDKATSLMAWGFGHDYYDYYEKTGLNLILEWRAPWPFGKAFGEFTMESIEPAQIFEFGSPVITERYFYGTSLLEGHEQNRLRLGYNSGPLLEVAGNKRLVVNLEIGSGKGLTAGSYSYSLVESELDWRIPTFLSRRFIPMSFDLSLRASYATDEVPTNRLGMIDSRLGVVAPSAVLRTGRNKPFYARKTLGLFAEHNFRTVPFELLGLDWFVEKGTSIQAYFGAVRAFDPTYGSFSCQDFDCEQFYLTSEFDQSEVGFSISSLFSIPARVDFTWRLDNNRNLFEARDSEQLFHQPAKRKRFYVTLGFSRLF